MEQVSKISAKVLCGDVKKAPDGELFTLVGFAVGIETGESTYGTWEALTGDFLADAGGKRYKAGKAFVPSIVISAVKPYLMKSEAGVQIAVRVGKRSDDSVAAGYVYTVEDLFPPVEDPLRDLLDAAIGIEKQIAAPKTEKASKK